MNAPQLTYAVTAAASALAHALTPGELALLASLLVQLGDTLATLAAQKALHEERAAGQSAP